MLEIEIAFAGYACRLPARPQIMVDAAVDRAGATVAVRGQPFTNGAAIQDDGGMRTHKC